MTDHHFSCFYNMENEAGIMHSEMHRLVTFVEWPLNAEGFPTLLANAGFYYSGYGDEVTCFSCGLAVSGWEFVLVPREIHAWLSPFCRLVLGVEDTNMPFEGRPLRCTTPMHLGLMNHVGAVANPQNTSYNGTQDIACSSEESAGVSLRNEARGHCVTSREVDRHFQDRAALNDADEAEGSHPVEKGDENNNDRYKDHRGEAELEGRQPRQGNDPDARLDICVENIEEDDELYEELIRENRRLKDEMMCKICYEEDVSILFLPCGHLVTCLECACLLRENICPFCEEIIFGTIRVYLA